MATRRKRPRPLRPRHSSRSRLSPRDARERASDRNLTVITRPRRERHGSPGAFLSHSSLPAMSAPLPPACRRRRQPLRQPQFRHGAWLLALVLLSAPSDVVAQRLSFSSEQNVSPAYEGWEQDVDGSRYFLFGYMNRNWEEEPTVPVGPKNAMAPGVPDQGQPTRFLPRRNRFVFRVPIPDDFGTNDELVWTLTVNGVTERAYATLRQDYFVDGIVRASEHGALGAGTSNPIIRANVGPSLRVDGDTERTVRVGEPLTLVAVADDDGVPESRRRRRLRRNPGQSERWRPHQRGTVSTETGLRVSWFVYRGAGRATFEPPQIKVWEDTRTGSHSPWAPHFLSPDPPPDGRWITTTTFDSPGTYVLRCLASDGALDVASNITVTVTD